jgi:hypothetical protein
MPGHLEEIADRRLRRDGLPRLSMVLSPIIMAAKIEVAGGGMNTTHDFS